MPATSLPAAVVVSMAAPCPVNTFRADAAPSQVVHGVDEMSQVASEPIQFPHDQCVASPQRLQAARQAGPIRACRMPGPRKDVLDRPSGNQRVALQNR